MTVVGLDIGGANIKASDGARSLSMPFELWKVPEALREKLRVVLSEFESRAGLAVTMTGELADCFNSKSEGVAFILQAVEQSAGGRPVQVWQTGGEFVSLDEARELVPLVAAANWHALATWAGRMSPAGTSLLIDVGSTTTDLIPMENGIPVPAGRTDLERLASGELLYLGVRRTPVCSLLSEVQIGNRAIGIARELFATTYDVCLLLGRISAAPDCHQTADGRPATRAAAEARLARMLCADCSELDVDEIRGIAELAYERMHQLLRESLEKVWTACSQSPAAILLSGEGEFIASDVIQGMRHWDQPVQIHSLGKIFGNSFSQAACAFALSRLAIERN